MVSACINSIATSPEIFLDCSVQTSARWISPRVSFSSDFVDDGGNVVGEKLDQDDSVMDFEFRLNDPVHMLTPDELFSEGKLVPLHRAPIQSAIRPVLESRLPAPIDSRRREKISVKDLCAFSPKAPRCSSVWKELLGLNKAHRSETENQTTDSPSKISNVRSLTNFINRNSRSASCDSISSIPLLRDTDSESLLISARASLSSSSSSGADYEDLPRLSLDSDKINSLSMSTGRVPPRVRGSKTRPLALRRPYELPVDGNNGMRMETGSIRWSSESDYENLSSFSAASRNLMRQPQESDELHSTLKYSMDSPRLNASGKVIFQGLGRSASSPNFINGGPKARPPGMERSYSANVRVTPLLNVPVCHLRSTAKSVSAIGFSQLFSPHKKEKEGSSAAKKSFIGVAKTKSEKSVGNCLL